ncbi:PREDICTED: uncharacterized protein LOC106747819 [Dinoponera quadriceps]|uniref:Uncharacterized protein LOC106747819 n=1 Tax=Dinoponera quadriceps TaxID=609295 RepID=A0A6P3XSQ1_DINQU|nr:PREDICTED: uncharacterized protein LOC106747819 [Dinoponera quadriceps]
MNTLRIRIDHTISYLPPGKCQQWRARTVSGPREHGEDLFDLYKSKSSGANDDANMQSDVSMLSIVYHFTSVSHDITQRYDGFDCRSPYQTHPSDWAFVSRLALSCMYLAFSFQFLKIRARSSINEIVVC